jgi:hypothetical protein
MFYKLRSVLPKTCLKQLYFALVHSRLLYGIEVYGGADLHILNKLIVLNNKILRILQFQKLHFPLKELYREYSTLPIPAMREFRILLFMYKYTFMNHTLPPALRNYFTTNSRVHNHDTRNKNNFHIYPVTSNTGLKTVLSTGSRLWNDLPQIFKQLSFKLFKKTIKEYLLNKYFN